MRLLLPQCSRFAHFILRRQWEGKHRILPAPVSSAASMGVSRLFPNLWPPCDELTKLGPFDAESLLRRVLRPCHSAILVSRNVSTSIFSLCHRLTMASLLLRIGYIHIDCSNKPLGCVAHAQRGLSQDICPRFSLRLCAQKNITAIYASRRPRGMWSCEQHVWS